MSYLLFTLQKSLITSVFYIGGSIYANNHSYPNNKMFSSGFVTYGMYLIAGKKVYQNRTTGNVLNPRWPPVTLREGNCYE